MQTTQPPTARIIIIDDNPSVLSVLVSIVESLGYEASPASTGPRGLALIADRRPDLVMLDLNMPGMSGQEVLDHLIRTDAQLPVLIITGNASADEEADLRRRGAVGLLRKPVAIVDLQRQIEAALRLQR